MKRLVSALSLTLVLLFVATGATCNRARVSETQAPAAFAGPPNLEQIVYAVNANSHRVQQLQTDGAKLTVAGFPPLRADMALEQPRRFRLRAQLTGVTGPEIDMGSNNEEFWLWVKRADPPAMYFARHAEFSRSAARNITPMEPEWLIEALGLVNFDPGGEHQGPFASGQGRVEIRSKIPTAEGELTKITWIHDTYGWVLEQQVRDQQGQLLAVAQASNFQFYPSDGVSLPHTLQIQLPPANLTFQLEISRYLINRLATSPEEVFTRPQIDGYPVVDLATPNLIPSTPSTPITTSAYPTAPPPPQSQPNDAGESPYIHPRTGYRPRYRGYTIPR